MSRTTEQIKERLSIVDVVGTYIKLEKAGSNFKARCPFHHERTPSFFISPSRNTFYCFGCGEKGDIFSFIERFEGTDFQGALTMLAEKAGVPIIFESTEKKQARDILFRILENATAFFEGRLVENPDALTYLKERGLTDETIKKFRIGFVPNKWNLVYDYLKGLGYTDRDIDRAGLIKKGEKGYYDRFRSRIMFPIADPAGRIVAFSGRIFPHDPETAKYINSPETELFNKSKTLYGLHLAKFSIRKANFSIVVEGQMDLLMSHQSGFPNTVALSGTALTQDHIDLLSRLSSNIVFALDADSAGFMSSGKSARMTLASGMDVKVARMPEGIDPADLAKKDVKELRAAIRNSVHIITYYLEVLARMEEDKRKFGRKVRDIVLPFVARIQSRIDQMHFVREVASRLGVSEEVVLDEVKNIPRDDDVSTHRGGASEKEIEKEVMSRKDMIVRRLLGIIFSEKKKKSSVLDLDGVTKKFTDIIGQDTFNSLSLNQKDVEEETLFTIESGYEDGAFLEKDVEELLSELAKEHLHSEYQEALVRLRKAETDRNEKAITQGLSECKTLADKINRLKTE